MTEDTYRDKLNSLQVEIEELRAKLKESQTGDTISRQAAIDALEQMRNFYSMDDCPNIYAEYKRIIDKINNLPSAQPEITMEDVEEYCRKRCLIVITNELFHQMRAKWSRPEIERCRDCQNYDGGTCTRLLLRIDDIRCTPYKPNDFGYCSLAERRTDDC